MLHMRQVLSCCSILRLYHGIAYTGHCDRTITLSLRTGRVLSVLDLTCSPYSVHTVSILSTSFLSLTGSQYLCIKACELIGHMRYGRPVSDTRPAW